LHGSSVGLSVSFSIAAQRASKSSPIGRSSQIATPTSASVSVLSGRYSPAMPACHAISF
ncbi:hypothetical protein Pmar_PMAR027926, partial [Perkinsus marinus ATCC 50983]